MSALDFLISFPAAQRALMAGIAVALVCSLLSVFVVLKRMAFIGQGVSHAGYGAAGTAFFLGLTDTDPRYDLIVFAFCIATALVIGLVSRHRKVESDTAIGILLVAAMAWGVLLTNLSAELQKATSNIYWPWYAKHMAAAGARPNFEAVLFGSILNTTHAQLMLALIVSALVIITLVLRFKPLVFFAFDEPTSRVYGVPATLMHHLLLTLLAIVVVLTMKLAGVLLVSAMLVIPGAAALTLSNRLSHVFVWSCLTGFTGVVGGLFVSLQLGFAGPGPCIVAVLCLLFALSRHPQTGRVALVIFSIAAMAMVIVLAGSLLAGGQGRGQETGDRGPETGARQSLITIH